MFQGKRLHCEFVCDELCSHPCLNLPCVSMSVYAGCCLCIHSSTEGPAMRTECPPPLAPQCAWHASLCQLSSPSPCLPCFPVIRHHPPYHAPSLVQTDTHSHDSTHIPLKWTAFPETPAPLRSKYITHVNAHAHTYPCMCTLRFLGHVHLHIHTLNARIIPNTPRNKQHYICMLRHGLTPTPSQAHVCYLSVTHSICFCLHA